MKPLKNLNNVEKGRLLAELFPNETQGMVDALKGAFDYLMDNEYELRQQGDINGLPIDFWYRVAKQVGNAIEIQGNRLAKKPRMFADQLFDGYNALFTVDTLVRYRVACDNKKFQYAVQMLFE